MIIIVIQRVLGFLLSFSIQTQHTLCAALTDNLAGHFALMSFCIKRLKEKRIAIIFNIIAVYLSS